MLSLYAVIVFIYIIESITLLRSNAFVVSAWFFKSIIESGKTGFGWSGMTAKFPSLFYPLKFNLITETLPFAISPEGITNYTGDFPEYEIDEQSYSFDEIKSVVRDVKKLKINGTDFTVFQSEKLNRVSAKLIKNLSVSDSDKRQSLVTVFLNSRFNPEEIKSRLNRFEKFTLVLDIFANLYWLYLFVALPVLLFYFDYHTHFEPLLYILLGTHLSTLITYIITDLMYNKTGKKLSRIGSYLYLLISPFLLIRSKVNMSKEVLFNIEPFILLSHFDKKNNQTDKVKLSILNYYYPVYYSGNDVYDWYSSFVKDKIGSLQQMRNYFPKPQLQKDEVYCPRCLNTYKASVTECADCKGIKLVN